MVSKDELLRRLSERYGITELDQYVEAFMTEMWEKFETKPILEKLAFTVIQGKIDESVPLTEEAMRQGTSPLEIINDGLAAGMKLVGEYFKNRIYFLPEVLLAAQAMQNALELVLPKLQKLEAGARGTIVVGTVEGDIHDIGKNIVKALLTAAGYTVHDLGRDVPIDSFIEKAREVGAQVVAMSTLMTPTLESVKRIEQKLKDSGLKGKVRTIVGGGSVTPEFAESVGSDAYGKDASEAVARVSGLIEQITMAAAELKKAEEEASSHQ